MVMASNKKNARKQTSFKIQFFLGIHLSGIVLGCFSDLSAMSPSPTALQCTGGPSQSAYPALASSNLFNLSFLLEKIVPPEKGSGSAACFSLVSSPSSSTLKQPNSFLSDPGVPGVRSMGPDETQYDMLLKLN